LKFKIRNGFTPEEVLSKQFSLEGILNSNTHSVNRSLLSSVGFENITSIMRYGEFHGYICIK
jgi:tRNA (cmo5U34)-methyltransferase